MHPSMHSVTADTLFGVGADDDPNAPVPVEQDNYSVSVPEVEVDLPDNAFALIQDLNPFQDDGSDGVTCYLLFADIIRHSVSSG